MYSSFFFFAALAIWQGKNFLKINSLFFNFFDFKKFKKNDGGIKMDMLMICTDTAHYCYC